MSDGSLSTGFCSAVGQASKRVEQQPFKLYIVAVLYGCVGATKGQLLYIQTMDRDADSQVSVRSFIDRTSKTGLWLLVWPKIGHVQFYYHSTGCEEGHATTASSC